MEVINRISAFARLGERLNALMAQAGEKDGDGEKLDAVIASAGHANSWFTRENTLKAFGSIASSITAESLEEWLQRYQGKLDLKPPKNIGTVMAGNIPLVGFHDFLCVLLSGNRLTAKLSVNDRLLLPFLAEILIEAEPGFREMIRFENDQLKNVDAVIATGSNNTSRYFEYYFGKYPHIIRMNRNAVAIISGNESGNQLEQLGNDIFGYFGLGCRSVSKLFVPEGYDFDIFFRGIYPHKAVIDHHKYANNYEYNRTVYLMGNEKFLDNGFLILKEDIGLASPVSVLFYEHYKDDDWLSQRLAMDGEHIQCIISAKHIPFGNAQSPELWDYADGIDTMQFLLDL